MAVPGLAMLLSILKVPPFLLIIPVPAAVARTCILLKLMVFSAELELDVVMFTVILLEVIVVELIVTPAPLTITVPCPGLNSKLAVEKSKIKVVAV